jgi:hypothetical protein
MESHEYPPQPKKQEQFPPMQTPLREQFERHPEMEQSGPEKPTSHKHPEPPTQDPCILSEKESK